MRPWAEAICFRLASHLLFNVRGNAILGLGHIARTCRQLDLSRALPVISLGLSDPHDYVRGQADSAASDLHTYLGVVVPGYDTELTNRVVALAQDLLEFNGTLRTDE